MATWHDEAPGPMAELVGHGDFEGAAALFVSSHGGVKVDLFDQETWDAIEAYLPTSLQLELEDGCYYPRVEYPVQPVAGRAVA